MAVKRFMFNETFLLSIEALKTDEEKLRLFYEIVNYGLYNKYPEESVYPTAMSAFRDLIDEQNCRPFYGKSKGGRPKKEEGTNVGFEYNKQKQ